MRGRVIAWMLLTAGTGCGGCRQPLAPCSTTGECLASEVCVDQRCRVVCNSAAECPLKGETCINGACLPGIDAGNADAAGDGSTASDAAGRDGAAGDRLAADQTARDGSADDRSRLDARADTGPADGAARDRGTDGGTSDAGTGADSGVVVDAGTGTDVAPRDQGPRDTAPRCNNGIPEPGEVCDDLLGNTDVWLPHRHCNTSCTGYGPYCGDGVVDNGFEACDDGPANGDGWSFGGHCSAACGGLAPRCGDGTSLTPQEQCDDGNADRHDGCAWCTGQRLRIDTGQFECVVSGNWGSCPTIGEALFGQDAQYGPNLQSLIDNADGTVTDRLSGLTWEAASSPRIDFLSASNRCSTMIQGGQDDWRLPTAAEWISILDLSRRNPPLSGLLPYGTEDAWSNTPVVMQPGNYWVADLDEGMIEQQSNNQNRTVCVRGDPLPGALFTDGSTTVIDQTTALVWNKDYGSNLRWQEALAYCRDLEIDGRRDWRLPDLKELASLQDRTRADPAIDTRYFSLSAGSDCWSATSLDANSGWAWVAGFGEGRTWPADKWLYFSEALCVRDLLPVAATLPETGQTRCYDRQAPLDCGAPGNASLPRQDAQVGANALLFSPGGSGDWLHSDADQLLWWASAAPPRPYATAVDLCRSSRVGGFADWRLPRIEELRAIVHYGRTAPAVDPLFVVESNAFYWSQTPQVNGSANLWTVALGSGESVIEPDWSSGGVLCVRGGWWHDSAWVTSSAGIEDRAHRLLWENSTGDSGDWTQALQRCAALSLGGHADWRLPSIKELSSLVDFESQDPAVAAVVAPSTYSQTYWSSTSNVDDPTRAWQVVFGDGSIAAQSKDVSARIRCVRSTP